VTHKVARKLQPVDAAYLAGLIDGEGTVTLARRHANEHRQLVVSISSTERDLVEWALHVTSVGKITSKRTTSARHAPGLAYSVSNRQALDVLRQVAPYLRSYKQRRACLALERYEVVTPRNGKYTDEMMTERETFVREFPAVTARGGPRNRRA
jgi:hypothetical protein